MMKYIVINTKSRKLTLYENNYLLRQFPVAVGKAATPTPHGQFNIANKAMHPGGVFGSRWLGLSAPQYGIHGTNNPSSIGQSISKGCIRMHNSDVEQLYNLIDVGTPVYIRD
jgi:lipoprotein-anchoring transpeptidase ErfK/SrfK